MPDFETDCFPVCRPCKERGSCDKAWLAPKASGKTTSFVSLMMAEHERRQAALKKLHVGTPAVKPVPDDIVALPGGYFRLVCDHWAGKEEQVRLAVFRPRSKKNCYWCGQCSKWLTPQPKPEPAPLPDDPGELF